MKRSFLLPLLLCVSLWGPFGIALASDPIGIYTVIDRVVLEPDVRAPERIQIHGAFTLARGFGGVGDPQYEPPVRGYFYYVLQPGQEGTARAEWRDMASVAGTGQAVAFASRYDPRGRVRDLCEAVADPDPYPNCSGICKIRSDTEYEPIQTLLSLPNPVSPLCSDIAERGYVTLVTRNILSTAHPDATYRFTVFGDIDGPFEVEPVPAGTGETTVTPALGLQAGKEYTWLVQAVDGAWAGPVATSRFRVDAPRGDVNGDGNLDISDAVRLLFFLFIDPGIPDSLARLMDANGDSEINVSDAVYILNYLFRGGPEPPPLFPTGN
jgi:hypothetical protein